MTKVIIIIVSKLSPASTPFRLDDRHPSRPLPQEERPSALQCANNDHSSPTGQKRVKFSASDGELGVGRGVGVGGCTSSERTRHPQFGVAEVLSLCCALQCSSASSARQRREKKLWISVSYFVAGCLFSTSGR